MREHLKEIRAGLLGAAGAALITPLTAVFPEAWLRAFGISWSPEAIWTIRWTLVACGIGLFVFLAWQLHRRIRARIASLTSQVSRLEAENAAFSAEVEKLKSNTQEPARLSSQEVSASADVILDVLYDQKGNTPIHSLAKHLGRSIGDVNSDLDWLEERIYVGRVAAVFDDGKPESVAIKSRGRTHVRHRRGIY